MKGFENKVDLTHFVRGEERMVYGKQKVIFIIGIIGLFVVAGLITVGVIKNAKGVKEGDYSKDVQNIESKDGSQKTLGDVEYSSPNYFDTLAKHFRTST